MVALNQSVSAARRAVALVALTATFSPAAMITNPGRARAVAPPGIDPRPPCQRPAIRGPSRR